MSDLHKKYKITFNKFISENREETRLIAGQYITLNQVKLVKYFADFYLRFLPLRVLNIQINKSEMEG